MAAEAATSEPQGPDATVKQSSAAKPDAVGVEVQAVEHVKLPRQPTSAVDEGAEESPAVIPDWLTDLKIFVVQTLEWAQEGSAKRSKRVGAKPPKRRLKER